MKLPVNLNQFFLILGSKHSFSQRHFKRRRVIKKKFVMISGPNCPGNSNTTKMSFKKIFSYRKPGRKNTFGIGCQ
jgi:hypothetical protein